MSKVIDLGTAENAFARGGNRLCFIDPDDRSRCIKVLRPDRSPAVRRAEKSFPKSLKPLHVFDDNLSEQQVYNTIDRVIGEPAYELVPRCFGFVDTNLGRGLCSELIRDENGLISISLKQYVWQNGVTDTLEAALKRFTSSWHKLGMPSRNLLLHNIVVEQSAAGIERLVVIDGLGWADFLPLAYYLPFMARHKAARKIKSLYKAIDYLQYKKEHDIEYGYHGWLEEQKRTLS